jgi:ribonuclease R
MRDRLGEEFSGTVTAVTSFGLFVTLDALYVEGLVHITELGGEYFRYDEARQELRGERTGVRYVVGSRVRVQVSRVDLDGRRIDFRLVHEGAEARVAGRRGMQGKAIELEPRAGKRRGRKGGNAPTPDALATVESVANATDLLANGLPEPDRSRDGLSSGAGAAAQAPDDAAVADAAPATAVEQLRALKEESRSHKAAARTARKTSARKSAASKTAAAKTAAAKTRARKPRA